MTKNNSIVNIVNDIVDIIANKLKTESSKISPHCSFSKLGLESLQLIEILYEIEARLGLGHLTVEKFSKINTIYDFALMVESNTRHTEK